MDFCLLSYVDIGKNTNQSPTKTDIFNSVDSSSLVEIMHQLTIAYILYWKIVKMMQE